MPTTPQYPYGIVPEYPDGSLTGYSGTQTGPCLKCPPATNIRAILFDCKKLAVIKGAKTEASMDLSQFFIPITNYVEFEYMIPANTDSIVLDYGMIASGSNDTVKFVALYPYYMNTGLAQVDWYIYWKFTDDASFKTLGRIMMLSGTDEDLVDSITLGNPHDVAIPLRIMLAV